MRAIPTCLLLCLALSAHAREWKNEIFHCAANIPDSAGWQMIEAPPWPGIAPVLAMQHSPKQAVFGINVVEKYRDANLANPTIQRELETMLQQLGYQFAGHSNLNAGGIAWLQYSVRAGAGQQQVSGLIRYASVGGYVFSITMLRGGGQDGSQDVELQQAAATFRLLPAGTAAAGTARVASTNGQPPAPVSEPKAEDKAALGEEETSGGDNARNRMIWIGGTALVVLIVFFSIIGGGSSKKR